MKQETLRRLLIEEENRFGATADRLRIAERYITDGLALIVRQADLVAKLDGNSHDIDEAGRTLHNFQMVRSLFVDFRARVYEKIQSASAVRRCARTL